MAINATIYKATVQFSDLDRNCYSDHSLTLARHPSETDERMMIRLLAFVLNAPANNDLGTLEFGKDMWDPDEPCLIQTDLTGLTEHWIDVGQPDVLAAQRIGRAGDDGGRGGLQPRAQGGDQRIEGRHQRDQHAPVAFAVALAGT